MSVQEEKGVSFGRHPHQGSTRCLASIPSITEYIGIRNILATTAELLRRNNYLLYISAEPYIIIVIY